ncbi:ATP-binding protein [Shivajiella indica]|uniref:histidine kinase n=1 Tax=Shivajiella indica TaxID=872115 RepID=A0ABW5B5Z3_9BACT
MRKSLTPRKTFLFLPIFITLLFSCDRRTEVPFPENELSYAFPETKPFQMPEPKTFEWKGIHPDSVLVSKVPFDMDRLPSIPFSLNEFKPLKKPLVPQPLDWENLPEFPLNIDTISSKPVLVKHSILPEPIISEIQETIVPNTTSGIVNFPLERGNYGVSTAGLIIDDHNFVWQANRINLVKIAGDRFYSYPILSEIQDSQIIGMNKDAFGNIWLATSGNGIYRVNLETNIITNYNIPEGFPNFVFSIEFESDGKIWISSSRDALYILDPVAETIKRLPIQELEGISDNTPLAIKKDSHNNLWIGNRMDISIISPDRKSFKKVGPEQGLARGIKPVFFEDSQGNMWIGSINGSVAQFLSLSDKTLTTLGRDQGFEGQGIHFTEDKLNRIWIHDNNFSYVFDLHKGLMKTIQTNASLFSGFPGAVVSDSNGNLWLGSTNTGLLFIDPLGPLAEFFTANQGFEGNDFWSSFEDSMGRIWILSYKKVHIYDPIKNEMKFLGSEQGLRKGDGDYRHSSVLDELNIFIGTERGFSLVDLENKSITNVSLKQFPRIVFFSGFKDRKGNIWLSTNLGMFLFNSTSKSFKHLNQESGLSFNTVYSSKEGKDGRIYIATLDKLNILDPDENRIWHIGEEEGLGSDQILSILESEQGDYWLATVKGISVVDKEFTTITNIDSKNGLIPEDIYDLVESGENIYAGSGNGLVQIPKNQFGFRKEGKMEPFKIYNYANGFGFPYNDFNQNSGSISKTGIGFYGITPILAVTTQEPIFNPTVPEVFITGMDIMDQKTSFKRLTDILSQVKPGDTLWNATQTDFYFSDSKIESDDYLAKNKITWDSLSQAFNLPVGLKLPYDQNALHFYFENPDPRSRGSIVYSYILEGHDDTWSNPISEGKTKSYFNLSPGEYTLKVVSKGFNGSWSKPAIMKFTILPPWWQTWWGYLIFAMIFSGIVWVAVQIRSNILKKENRILEEKVKLRTAQLEKSLNDLKTTQSQLIQSEKMASLGELTAGIAHEIQNPLNFVNNFAEVSSELISEMEEELDKGAIAEAKLLSKDIRDNLQKIHHHGKRADSIVKGMLQHSRGTSGETKPTNINGMVEEYIRLSFQGFRARDKSFSASFQTELDPDLPRINVVRQDLGRVLLNLINNAFYVVKEKAKSGPEGYKPEVVVRTRKTEKGIEISVQDNGPGIPEAIKDKIFQPFFTTKPTGQGTGLGLSLSYDIVKAHGGDIWVESFPPGGNGEEGKGTTFKIFLPVS